MDAEQTRLSSPSKDTMNRDSLGHAIFVGTFGSLIILASIAIGFITADLLGIL